MEEIKIDFTIGKAKKYDDWWIDELEKQLEIQFNSTTGPLWRTIYYESDGTPTVLIFTFHHALVDGGSIMAFYEKFLSICAQLDTSNLEDAKIEETGQVEICRPINEIWKQPVGWFHGIKFIGKLLYYHFTKQFPTTYSPETWKSPGYFDSNHPRHSRIFPLTLNETQLNKLKLKCKLHDVTIHSAISAVAILAYIQYYNGKLSFYFIYHFVWRSFKYLYFIRLVLYFPISKFNLY